jgi:tRNA-specific adenosine deaminase 3
MPKTGGLTAELVSNDSGPVGLGYGLCWRKELNWQFMCWEYVTKNQEGTVLRTPAPRRGSRRGSSEKYTTAEETQATSGADLTLSSFASIHV